MILASSFSLPLLLSRKLPSTLVTHGLVVWHKKFLRADGFLSFNIDQI
jgi:hypothetical protein